MLGLACPARLGLGRIVFFLCFSFSFLGFLGFLGFWAGRRSASPARLASAWAGSCFFFVFPSVFLVFLVFLVFGLAGARARLAGSSLPGLDRSFLGFPSVFLVFLVFLVFGL